MQFFAIIAALAAVATAQYVSSISLSQENYFAFETFVD